MPPKKATPGGKGGKGGEGGKALAATAALPPLRVKKSGDEADADLIPALAAAPATTTNSVRRDQYTRRFREFVELILSSDATFRINARGPHEKVHNAAPTVVVDEDYFPTLKVGFIARAMGLNLTEEQVVQLVELVEDDTASRGTVSRRRLEGVIIDALMTGLLGGPTLVSSGVLTQRQMPMGWKPSNCLRSESMIYRAFAALDPDGKGYLPSSELRIAMTTVGDPLSTEEAEEMFVAIAEPGAEIIYYKDFADVLARE